jgi:hypothetical protein
VGSLWAKADHISQRSVTSSMHVLLCFALGWDQLTKVGLYADVRWFSGHTAECLARLHFLQLDICTMHSHECFKNLF